jgi:hypothetical protein
LPIGKRGAPRSGDHLSVERRARRRYLWHISHATERASFRHQKKARIGGLFYCLAYSLMPQLNWAKHSNYLIVDKKRNWHDRPIE